MEATAQLPKKRFFGDISPEWIRWIIAITVSLGAILEIIDTSIVNVALPNMQGNLGATLSEIGWVVTGYSIANVIMIPLTAWLSDFFGKKSYFVFSLVGFTLASVMCGFATSLPALVISRILQGLCGGGLLAKAQSILFETFPPEEQGMAQALFGVGVIVGPVIGPTLGGYLTDVLGWQWIFFINVPFGILAVVMALLFLPANGEKKKNPVDWAGIVLLCIWIGSLQTMLEQGQENDWFSSPLIVILAVAAFFGLLLFIWRELKARFPAVDLRVLRYKSLSAGSLFSAVMGIGLYGSMFAVPIFAQSILHYTAMQTGMLMLPGALASAAMMPVMGKLSNKVDPRIMIGIGSVITTIVMFMMATINPETGSDALFCPLLIRGIGNVFMFMSLSIATISPLPKGDIPAATGFYNLTRQMGGSIGVAAITLILDQREDFHRAVLTEHVNIYNPALMDRINQMTAVFVGKGIDPATAHTQALAVINQAINTQSAILSFADIFWLVGILFIFSLALLFFLGGPGNKESTALAH